MIQLRLQLQLQQKQFPPVLKPHGDLRSKLVPAAATAVVLPLPSGFSGISFKPSEKPRSRLLLCRMNRDSGQFLLPLLYMVVYACAWEKPLLFWFEEFKRFSLVLGWEFSQTGDVGFSVAWEEKCWCLLLYNLGLQKLKAWTGISTYVICLNFLCSIAT